MSRRHSSNEPSAPRQRQLRVGEEIRHVLAQIFERGEIRDPDLAGRAVTVTEVRISPDLKNATCYVMPLGGQASAETMAALRRSAPWLRGQVAHRMQLRYAPALGFELDHTFDHAQRIDELLHRPDVARDLTGDASEAAEDDEPTA